MQKTTSQTFNRKQVRPSFVAHYCGEYMLPSGKPSGYYRFPITDEEVNNTCQWLDPTEKPKRFWTWSEWALFTSLRVKYGFNYLKPKPQTFLRHIDELYAQPKEENALEQLENKLTSYCDFQLNDILKIALEKASNASSPRVTENEKNFRASLDNPDFDVLY